MKGQRPVLQTLGGLRARGWRRRSRAILTEVLTRLDQETPFAFARFNDGEMGAIVGDLSVISRGQQEVTANVRDILRIALQEADARAVIGIPCPVCYPTYRRAAVRLAGARALTGPATALQNESHRFASETIVETLRRQRHRRIHWVGSSEHDLSPIEVAIGREVRHWSVPDTDAFDSALAVTQTLIEGAEDGDVVLLSCGPASRVAAIRVVQQTSSTTALDIGSLFDPLTRGMQHGYHREDSSLICRACAGPTKRSGLLSFSARRTNDPR